MPGPLIGSRRVLMGAVNAGSGVAGGPITPLTLGTPLVGYDTHETDGINFIGTGADGDNISDFVDLTGNGWDASQGTGAQQPEILTVSGKRCASFTHAQTIIASAIDTLGATDFTVVLVGSVVTRTGTPATSDALFSIAGTGEETRLEAGNTSTFLSHYNNTGTGFADLNGTSGDLVNAGFQLFSYENGSAAQTAWLMNEVRATGAATGVHDASVNLTIGSNLAFTFRAMWIYDGTLTAAEHLSLANYYATQQSMTMVSGSWESRNTAVPTFTGTETEAEVLSGSAGTWVNARNTANSLTYQWYNNTDAGNATGTGNATINYTLATADVGDTVKLIETNTILTVASTADSANSGAIAAASSLWTPSELGSANLLQLEDAGKTLSGSDITVWADQSGNSWSPSQISTDGIPSDGGKTTTGGQDAVEFVDASSEGLASNAGPNTSFSTVTLVVLAQIDSASETSGVMASIGGTDVNINGLSFELLGATTSIAARCAGSGQTFVKTGAPNDAGYVLLTVTLTAAAGYNTRYNGAAVTTGFGTEASITLDGICLGRRGTGSNTRHFDGAIAAVSVTNTATLADIEKIEGWMAHHFGEEGILDAGHTYKSAAPTV